MTTSALYPGAVGTQPGSLRAKAVAAAAVITLATAIAGAALVAGITFGSAVEAPGQPAPHVTQPAESTSPITSAASLE